MENKVVLITGATDGIGRATAVELARRGARVVVVGRDSEKGSSVVAAMRAETSNQDVSFLRADLSRQSDIRSLARSFTEQFDRIDVLLNNVGGAFGTRKLSVDGIEMTFALNHLAPFLLTRLLLDHLQATPGSRIVNVASAAHRGVTLDFDDVESKNNFKGLRSYRRSKLCNLLFTYELARRLGPAGPTVNALHPGFVRTHLGQSATDNNLFWRMLARLIFRFTFAIDVNEGAKTSIHLATSPDLSNVTGKYFVKEREARSSAQSADAEAARHLWEISETMAPV